MIVRPRLHWLRMLFVWHGSVLRTILPQLAVIVALAVVVTLAHGELGHWKVPLTAVPFSLIGVSLAIFLGFRINASYDRYWEARKLWGAVLSESRCLARQALTLVDAVDNAQPRAFVFVLIGFAQALRQQLRGLDDWQALQPFVPPPLLARLSSATQRPAQMLLWLGEWLAERRRAGELSPMLAVAAETHLAGLTLALSGCERIATTPLPFTYSVIIHRTVYLYTLLLPFGLVDAIGAMTPLIVGFVAYAFFALDAVSDEIEQPFGTEPNDLPLDALATGIERSLREMLGDRELPPMPLPERWVLR